MDIEVLPASIHPHIRYVTLIFRKTTIEFNLPNSTIVSLKIFDGTGKEVVTLLNDFREAGNHKVNFEASKYSLSSGVYFYTLSANGFTQTKSMMLIK